jgi:acetyltransferase-like isoleucine patch superfamily enzyme
MNAVHLEHDWFSRPLPSNVRLGERTWLYSSYAFAHYESKMSIGLCVGNDTGLYHGTFFDVGPDAEIKIGDFCSLVGVIFATNGRVTIEDYTFIAHEVVIADSPWPLPGRRSTERGQQTDKPSIEIGRNVWIGAQALLVGNVRIGEGAIIGAGALVTQDVPPNSLCAGNPMRIMRTLSSGRKKATS